MPRNIHPARSAVTEEVGALMGRRRLKAKALASELGWGYGYLNRRLNMETSWSVDDLETVAAYFDVPITQLFGDSMVGWTPDLAAELVDA